MADERNFRSAYYEKVGFRSVEEKKSLEILLKEKPLDREKLKQFCLRFSVPTTYRNLIWKLLLGIIPVHVDSHNFVMIQRKQEYHDLLRALTVMRVIDGNTPRSEVILAMWLLKSGNYTIDTNLTTERPFTCIVQSFMQFFEDEADIFWLSRNFYENVKKFQPEIGKLVDKTHQLIEKEDIEYYKHISKYEILNNLPLAKWFECCFAGILNKTALERVWDKLCGGSYKILVFVAFVLLTTLKPRIVKSTNSVAVLEYIKNNLKLPKYTNWYSVNFDGSESFNENVSSESKKQKAFDYTKVKMRNRKVTESSVIDFCDEISVATPLPKISEETADVIANKSIEMWQLHGSPLTIHDKPKP